jgi:TRAP-type C4-dicarboxylate transport system permease small subunit
VERVLSIVAGLIMLVLTCLTAIDVLLRFLLNKPIPGLYELSELMLIGIVFLSIAYVQARKEHLRIDVLASKFPSKVQFILNIFGYLAGVFVFLLIAWRSGYIAWQAWALGDYSSGLVQWPIWPAKTVVPVGAGLISLRLIRDLYDEFVRSRTSEC